MKSLKCFLPARARGAFSAHTYVPAPGRNSLACRRRRWHLTTLAIAGIVTFYLAAVMAHTFLLEEFTCPIDGHIFSEAVSATGTSYGSRLDNKPLGPIAAPWDLAQCPKCKFVLAWVTNDTATVSKLRPFVLSAAYYRMATNGPTYLCLARLREVLAAPPLQIADAYLKASWQVEGSPARYREFLQAALTNYVAGIKTLAAKSDDRTCIERLCGELERRLSRFDEARARLMKLRETTTDREDLAILNRQLGFVDRQDSAPHASTEELESLVSGRR